MVSVGGFFLKIPTSKSWVLSQVAQDRRSCQAKELQTKQHREILSF